MTSRREFLMGCLGSAAPGSVVIPLPKRELRCRPVISGPMWWYSHSESALWDVSRWRDELDQQSRIGFNLLWLVNVAGTLTAEKDIRALSDLLDLCAQHKVQVILDIGASNKWYGALDLDKELAICSKNILKIGDRLRRHPAFWGWYIPHEIYMFWGEAAAYIESLYSGLVDRCKKAADLPVAISPFFILDRDRVFGDFRYSEPDEYRQFWERLIRRSRIDIVILQDSGEHFSYVTNAMRRPFLAAMHDACAGAKAIFWGNVETAEFECPSKEEFVRRYGKMHPSRVKGAPWRPVPIRRLREKLELAAEYSELIVTWGYWEHCRPSLGKVARQWYRDYKAYYNAAGSA